MFSFSQTSSLKCDVNCHLFRQRCIRLPDSDVEVGQVVAVLLDNIAAGDTNAMLATAALANIVAKAEHIRYSYLIDRLINLIY